MALVKRREGSTSRTGARRWGRALFVATATSLGKVANGRIGTLILTARYLHFVATATRGYEPNPGLPDRRIDILLTDIREVTMQGGALGTRIATGAAALSALAGRTSDEQIHLFSCLQAR